MTSPRLPLITHRIQFSSKVLSAAPLVTPRLEFRRQQQPTAEPHRELTPTDFGSEGCHSQDKELESELSDLTDIEEETAQPTTFKKIPKPSGEPGRPGLGGYNLDDSLASWGKDEILKVTRLVKKLAELKLDKTKPYSKQSSRKVDEICDEVARSHDVIQKYDDFWPIRAMIKMHLKSEAHRRGGGSTSNRNNKAVSC